MNPLKSRIALAVVASLFVGLVAVPLFAGDAAGQPAPATPTEAATPSGAHEATPPAATDKAPAEKKKKESVLVKSAKAFVPILILLVVVAFVIARLPKVKGLGHTEAYLRRRLMNWLPLGLTYAFLYMGRYNLKVSKFAFENMAGPTGSPLMGNEDFALIFMIGTIVYGCSFVINGPLTDRYGGKAAILTGAGGAAVANLLMGLASWSLLHHGPGAHFIAEHFVALFSALYGANMYFQSFGAVAIVKVNAPWFHVRERGVFGAIFGILISLGIYFAYDWGTMILGSFGLAWVFFAPAVLLSLFWMLDVFMVRNTPGDAGHPDFDTADASSGDDGPRLGAIQVFKLMLKNPVIVTIACIEFCSGFLRQSIMQWYRTFAKHTDGALHLKGSFVYENWGMLLCCAGIISDRVFGSRRGPVAALLYGVMLAGGVAMIFAYQNPIVGPLVIVMSMAIIGVHGMLSGTASMDFGGKKNVGVAVGIIDGFVYLGTAVMSGTYYFALPKEKLDEARHIIGPSTDPDNWSAWPISMVVVAVIGLFLARKVWHAMPKGRTAAAK